MIALMPLRDGHLIPADVMRGLAAQTVPMALLAVSRPGGEPARASEAATRNVLRLIALEEHPEDLTYLLVDSDTVMRDPGLVRAMEEKMYAGGYGAVAANVKAKAKREEEARTHVDMGCCLVGAGVLRAVSFRTVDGSCCCKPFTADVRAAGWEIGYLSLEPRGWEVPRQ